MVSKPIHQSKSIVGIDVGIANFATLSTGEVIKPLNQFRKLQSNLAKAQKKLARQKKFSNNWKKQKTKIQRLHTQGRTFFTRLQQVSAKTTL